MYLSRIKLDPSNRRVWRDVVAHPYRVHQLVMMGFSAETDRATAHILHRLEVSEQSVSLLVQSAIEPHWQTFDPRYLAYDPFDALPNPAVKKFPLEQFQREQRWRFRLRANPTVAKRRYTAEGKRRHSNRVPLVREAKQIEWLGRKAADHGYELQIAHVSNCENVTDFKPRSDGAAKVRPITQFSVQYDGILKIADADKFNTAWRNGIGPSKAFGCGLLSLAPA